MNQWGSIVPYFVMDVITNTMHLALTSLVLKGAMSAGEHAL